MANQGYREYVNSVRQQYGAGAKYAYSPSSAPASNAVSPVYTDNEKSYLDYVKNLRNRYGYSGSDPQDRKPIKTLYVPTEGEVNVRRFFDDYTAWYNNALESADSMDWASGINAKTNFDTDVAGFSERADGIRSWLDQNRESLDPEYVSWVINNLDTIAGYNQTLGDFYSGQQEFFGQWDSAEDYDMWSAYQTLEGRQQRYTDNQQKLADLNQQREDLLAAGGGSSFMDMVLVGAGAMTSDQWIDRKRALEDIDAQIAAVTEEINSYESGLSVEGGFYYGSKVLDDASMLQSRPDFAVVSQDRTGVVNPSKEDLDAYDATVGDASLALSSGGYYDDDGNVRDAQGNIVMMANGPEIQDKLGMYLAATPDDMAAAMDIARSAGGNYQTTWANTLIEGDVGRWSYLTEAEIDTYYYIMNTQGQEAAYQYLDDMATVLGMREADDFQGVYDNASFMGKVGLNIASIPLKLVGGVPAAIGAASDLIGGEYNPYSRSSLLHNMGTTVQTSTAKELDALTGGAEIPWINFGLGDLYLAGMSTIENLVGGRIGGGAYQVLMSSSAAVSEAAALKTQGATDSQIVMGALAAGAAEWVFERYSIDSLIKMRDAENWVEFFEQALLQGGIEMSEEIATETANIIANGLIMQSESDWQEVLDANGGDYGAAIIEMAGRVASAGVSGLFSGTASGSAQQYTQTLANRQVNARTGQMITEGGMMDALTALATEMAAGTADSTTKRQIQKKQDRLGRGFRNDDAKNRAVGSLYRSTKYAVRQQNTREMAKALEEKGFSEIVAQNIAYSTFAKMDGLDLTAQEERYQKKYADNPIVQEVLESIKSSQESGYNVRQGKLRDFEKGTYTGAMQAAVEKIVGNLEKETGKDYTVSDDGKTHLISDPEADVSVDGIASIKDGKMTVRLNNGKVVDAEDVSFGSNDDALIYSTLATMNVSAETANALVNNFKPESGVDADVFALDIKEAYELGRYNYPLKLEENDPYADAKRLVWNEGRTDAIKNAKREQLKADAKTRAAKEALQKEGKTGTGEHRAVLEQGISEKDMSESQKMSYQLADQIAQAAKVTIMVYDGKTGEWGYYSHKNDMVYLNLNSTRSGKSMMAFVLGHELVHRAKVGSPAKYQAFADFLMEQYGKQGSDIETMIGEELRAAREHDLEMTRDQAFEEVVADACQRMLLDTDAGKKLARFGAQSQQNRNLVDQIRKWIREFMDKLREMFRGVDPDSEAAMEFAKFDEGVKQILADMYVDMTIDAGAHLSVIQSAFGKNTEVMTNEQGEFTLAQNADGSEKIFNLVTWKNGGRETMEATLKREGYTKDEIDAALTIMDAKQQLVEDIANEVDGNGKMAFPEQGRINEATLTTDIKDGHAVLSALVSNGDYPVNIDLLMVCKKRKAYQRVINRLCETGLIQQATVDALAIAEINKILGKYGFETACLGCFVESRRLRIQEWAQTIVKEWNGEVKKRNPNAKPFGFGKGEATLTADEVMQLIGELESGGPKNDKGNLNLGQGSAVKRMGVLLDKVPSLRRTLSIEDLITPDGLSALRRFDGNLFSMVKSRYGSNSPKFVQEFNPYNHELAKYGTVPTEYKSLREYLYAIGGARMQSFSDFIVENWFDYCQIVADLAARKLPMHTYTKEIALAKLFGMTGIKINMSLIPDIDRSMGKEYAGLTRNADGELELIWADKDRFKATGGKSYMQSINFADAVALQNDPRYSANVGTIAIGVSDRQIRMMLADPRIRMVIPYHSSGMNPIFADLMGTSYYKDYTNYQNTTVKQVYNSKGQPVSLSLDKTQTGKLTGGFLFNKTLQELGDARAAAEAYKKWCADKSKHTITIKGETYTAELTPKFDDFKGEPNYYKLLEDFNPYDCITEAAAPQGDVQQVYPEGFEDILRAELKGQEKYRQKQEKNQAFDKAMGEIERYLQDHSKADTVHYANQHGIKLGAKDKKLNAADKAKLKRLQEEGASFKLPVSNDTSHKKITMSMTDSERTEILKDKVITAEVYEGQADNSIVREREYLESEQLGMIKAALKRIADEFGAYADYKIEDVEVEITFSQSNLEESVSKKITPTAVAKLMPVLKTAVESAIGIESHVNRYHYDMDIVRFDNLVGGYIDGDSFVPVRFGLKHRRNGEAILYVIVDQQKIDIDKIKAEVVKITGQNKLGQETSRSAFEFSLADFIPFVNGGDLLRYIPDDMINESQRVVKWDAIADTIKRTNDKNDRKYMKYIREGKLRVAKQMAQQAAKMNGYTIKAYHQTSAVFTEFSTANPVAGKNDSETPNGIFFKTNDHDIGLGGGIQMEVYLKAENMLHFADRKEANAWYRKNVPGYDALQKELDTALKPYLDRIDAITEQEWDETKTDEEIDALFEEEGQVIEEMRVVEDSYRARLRELLNQYFLNGESGYDGIELDYDGHRWVNGKREDVHTYIVFNPEQAKSADAITYDDNGSIIPISQRFDSDKKDIRYKLPVGEDSSPRAILANALESAAQTDIERRNIANYQKSIGMINDLEAKRSDLKAQLKELQDQKGSKQEISRVRDAIRETENSISVLDNLLLRMEAAKPLKDLLAREKARARQETRDADRSAYRNQMQAEQNRLQRKIDAANETIRNTKSDFATIEKEFTRLVKAYEADLRAEQKKGDARYQNQSAKVTELRQKLKDEAAAHGKDNALWEKQFNKLLREYEHAGQRIENMQKRAEQQRESASKAAIRKKLRKVIRDLDVLLNKGTKKKNVKEGLRSFVSEALATAEALMMDSYSNEDMVWYGIGTDLTKEEERLVRDTRHIMEMLRDLPTGDYNTMMLRQDKERRLKSQLAANMAKLKGVFERERERINRTTVGDAIDKLAAAYLEINNSDELHIRTGYHENVYQYLLYLKTAIGGTVMRDMSMDQLEMVYKAFTMVKTTVANANKTFAQNLRDSIETLAGAVMSEVRMASTRKGKMTAIGRVLRSFQWNNLKPVYAFRRLGSATMSRLWQNIRKGQDTWAMDIQEASVFAKALVAKYNKASWDMQASYSFINDSGMKFDLTLEEIMSLYAYSKREQAHKHLLEGGFVFDDNAEEQVTKNGITRTYLKEDATAYRLSLDLLEEIHGKLTDEQKAYADEMQDYLSRTMGEKGNEVSLQLYGIRMFNETHYWPLKSAGQYMERAKEADLKKEQGQINLANAGFSRAVVPEARNPVVLRGFMDTWAGHVNEMSMYHSFVLPMEDFRRVYNFTTSYEDEGETVTVSVNSAIQDAHGKAAIAYIDQLYRDINGGAVGDPRETVFKRMVSRFKKAAVFASASVVIQQPSAIGRALSEIDPTHFVGQRLGPKKHAQQWEELKRYAPVAFVKEMGQFDVGMGMGAEDYLKAEEYPDFKEKAKAFVKESDYRDEIIGRAPALADEVTWLAIWDAVKRETAAKHPDMNPQSEEFLQLAGERFSEVIDLTQVYDSVLARSANMRSKGLFMGMATAFLAEPTTSANMMEDALLQAKRGNKKAARRAMASVYLSVILNAALVSLVYADRDDDEDETFLEKYFSSFAVEILDGINPLTYYPLVKDIWSLAQGWDVERTDMAIFSDVIDSFRNLITLYGKDVSGVSGDDRKEHKRKLGRAWWSIAESIGSVLGIPLKNVLRDIRAAGNVISTIRTDIEGRNTTLRSLGEAMWGDAQDALPIIGWMPSATKGDALYAALVRGDVAYAERLMSGYKDENSANYAITESIEKQYKAGKIDFLDAADHLVNYAGKDYNEAAWTIFEWDYEMEYDDDFKKYGEFFDAVESGQNLDAIIKKYTDNGVSEDTLRGQITSHFKPLYMDMTNLERDAIRPKILDAMVRTGSYMAEAEDALYEWDFEAKHGMSYDDMVAEYKEGNITRDKMFGILMERGYTEQEADAKLNDWSFVTKYGAAYEDREMAFMEGRITVDDLRAMYEERGKTPEEIDDLIDAHNWLKDHPQYDLYASTVVSYIKPLEGLDYSIEDTGMDIDTFLRERSAVKEFRGDTDENGKSVPYSKINKAFPYIDSLDLTPEQKTALAVACGWSLKTVENNKLW